MSALAVPALSIGVALGAGGLAKVRQPSSAAPLLAAARLPSGRGAAVLLGAVELTIAAAAVAIGGRALHAAVAALFAAFAAVLWVVLRSGDAPSCGCFGRRSAPPHLVHVAVDATAALLAGAAAATDVPGVVNGVLDGGGSDAVAIAAMAALGGALVVATLTVLPEVLTTARQHGSTRVPAPFRLLERGPS